MTARLVPPSPVSDDAEFARDGQERVWLSRKVSDVGPVGVFLGLNPSKAGATNDDPTIRKEKEFARRWGWSGFWKLNLFTCIETHSAKLKAMSREAMVGEHGDAVLDACLPLATAIVVCWGSAVPPERRYRVREVCDRIRLDAKQARVWCFGLNKDGAPVHPLYLPYETELAAFEVPERMHRRGD